MAETWYRGEADGVAPSRAGGDLHDLGDGLYLTSQLDVAQLYAKTRAQGNLQLTRVYEVDIDHAQLGRVLNLTTDRRWTEYMKQQVIPGGPSNEQLIRQANENYGRFFQSFLQQERIDINHYDSVIGPEFVRGGKQICILMKNGQPSRASIDVRGDFKLVYSGGKEVETVTVRPPNVGSGPSIPLDIPTTNSRIGQALGNQAAVAMAGVMLESMFMAIGDIGIERRVRAELQFRYANSIARFLSQGQGVLVIISLAQWQQPDFNGFQARMFLTVNIQPGKTADEAMKDWWSQPHLLPGAPSGYEPLDTYSWIEPGS
jgi:hypothetical protein